MNPVIGGADLEKIRAWDARQQIRADIRLLETEDPRSGQLRSFLDQLTGLSDKIRGVTGKGEPQDLPALVLDEGLRYLAVPSGPELVPFLELLSAEGRRLSHLPDMVGQKLREVRLPAVVKIYITPPCPFCPAVVRKLAPLHFAAPHVHISIIDAALFPEQASMDDVKSVPTVILDGRLRWTGQVRMEEILDALVDRDPALLGTHALKGIVKDGNAALLARMMVERGKIFPGFLGLLIDPDWSLRLGAMVTLEEIAASAPHLASNVLDELWARLPEVSDPVRGDVFYLTGILGSGEWIPRLQGALSVYRTPDLAAAIEDALDALGNLPG